MRDLTTINQELETLRAQAAQLNFELLSAETKENKRSKTAAYMELSAKIAVLKKEKAEVFRVTPRPSRNDSVKIATLLFPAEQKVQYFATNETFIELLVTLKDVFDTAMPAVTSFFSVAPDQVSGIPPEWYELVNDKDETGSI
jgi:hypothetical protein